MPSSGIASVGLRVRAAAPETAQTRLVAMPALAATVSRAPGEFSIAMKTPSSTTVAPRHTRTTTTDHRCRLARQFRLERQRQLLGRFQGRGPDALFSKVASEVGRV